MRMIGQTKDSRPMYAVDAYLEPADCPRPWTPEIKAAFERLILRDHLDAGGVSDRKRARGEFLHAALCQIIGTKAADEIRGGV